MQEQQEQEIKPTVNGHIEIGNLILSTVDTYNGTFWISRPDGEGMQVGADTLDELIELLEAFYRKHL